MGKLFPLLGYSTNPSITSPHHHSTNQPLPSSILNPPPTSATGKPVGGIAAGNGTGSASPSGTVATTATTAAPTSSPIAPYVPNAAPAIQASWTGLAALAMGLIYLNA